MSNHFRIKRVSCVILLLFVNVFAKQKEGSLTARDLLETIAPTYNQAKLPPGFPSLDTINTDKFDYTTGKDVIKVSAKLSKAVVMIPDYVTLSNVQINFTFNKKAPKNSGWKTNVTASWSIGSTILHVVVTQNGKIHARVDELRLRDIVHEFMKEDSDKDIGIDLTAITLSNTSIEGDVSKDLSGFNVNFVGKLDHVSSLTDKIPIKITVNKYGNNKANLYSVLEFRNATPEKILKSLLNERTLNIPFFAHMLSDSSLFSDKKEIFGLSFSYREIYYYNEHNIPGDILRATLQSHIPVGIALLFPLKVKRSDSLYRLPNSIKIAFVINKPAFDLLISQNDKIAIQQILPVLSKEFESDSLNHIPNFMRNVNDAYTTHISFDSTSTIFSIFVRLHDTINLAKNLIHVKLSHLVLQRNVGRDDSKQTWKVAAKGTLKIGKSKLYVQYSELSDEPDKPYGLTGFGKEVSLEDVISEFHPDFFPDPESEEMIENTEIETLKIHKVRIYSRIPRKTEGIPHILITGFTNLVEWEKDIQMAILLIYQNKTWFCKWAASLKHSPLSNIIQALTGFDSRDLTLLHNGHILTTIMSSTLPSYNLLPPHIITTPLLRLPVKKAVSIVALLRFPDNCGDDKLCTASTSILDTSKVYTVKGIVSLDGFKLKAKIPEPIILAPNIQGTNSSLQFTIGNDSKMDILTSISLPHSSIIFDGTIHVYKTGQLQLQMYGRRKHWNVPLGLRSISFENLQLVTFYKSESDLRKLKLEGVLKLGTQGNGGEIKAPLNLNYDYASPSLSTFFANFSEITLGELMTAFSIQLKLPNVLEESDFPNGLMLSYSGKEAQSTYEMHGEINIFGRLLNCVVKIKHPGRIEINTVNSPAPVIFATGLIIIQQDMMTKLRGPMIVASIDHRQVNVTVKGFVKVLGIESKVNINLKDNGIKFSVTGKLMGYKPTTLTATSLESTDNFQVSGCLYDITPQVEELLVDIISRSANQSLLDMEKANENYMKASRKYDLANLEEDSIRQQTLRSRDFYEEHLLAFGRNEIKVNDTCVAPKCGLKCFGCPKLNKCCRLDIFGHCIACSSWKQCCWKNINPLCIAKHDGCHVVKTVAEQDLTEREAQLIQQKIQLDNLDHRLLQSEFIKGRQKAILDAAVDAKQIISEEASPGLNAYDVIKGYGNGNRWANVFSICYNTTIQQASTGCMEFKISSQFFNQPVKDIYLWSCLKSDLLTEITESIANYLFPNIIDTNTDSITEIASRLNEDEFDNQMEYLDQKQHNKPTSQIVVNEIDKDGEGTPIVNVATTSEQENHPQQPDLSDQPSIANKNPTMLSTDGNLQTQPVTAVPSQSMKATSSTPEANPIINAIQPPIFASEIKDQDLLSDALEGAAEGEEEVVDKPSAPMSQPANSISANGKPQVTLIEASRLKNYQQKYGNKDVAHNNDDSENKEESDDNEDEGDDDDNSENGSGEGELSGQKSIDKELKQLYDFESSGSGANHDKKIKNKQTGLLADQLIEQEEMDSEMLNKQVKNNKQKRKQGKKNKHQIKTKKLTSTDFNEANKTQLKISYPKPIEMNDNVPQLNGYNAPYKSRGQNFSGNSSNQYATSSKGGNNYQTSYPAYNQYKVAQPNQNVAYSGNTTKTNPYWTFKPYTNYNNSGHGNVGSTVQYHKALKNMKKAKRKKQKKSKGEYSKPAQPSKHKLRNRRNIDEMLREKIPVTEDKVSHKLLFTNPFWNIRTDHDGITTRSKIPSGPNSQLLMRNVIHKRWKIPENSNGRCHVFHQLIAICKDMAETILMLDKSLHEAKQRFNNEDKDIYLELFETEEFLIDAGKRINVSAPLMHEVGKTLSVVRQGVNIWSQRCTNEFDWQNESGVQTWLQAMDIRIQELGGYGVYRFLENLFHAFEALFEALTYSDSNTSKDAMLMVQKIRKISQSFDQIFRHKLSVDHSRDHAEEILKELGNLRKITTFC